MSCGWELCLPIHRCFSFLHVLLFLCMYFLFAFVVYFAFLFNVFSLSFCISCILCFSLFIWFYFICMFSTSCIFSAIFVSLPLPKTSKPAEMWSLVKKRGNVTIFLGKKRFWNKNTNFQSRRFCEIPTHFTCVEDIW